jgi:hypothetical protein
MARRFCAASRYRNTACVFRSAGGAGAYHKCFVEDHVLGHDFSRANSRKRNGLQPLLRENPRGLDRFHS